MWSTSIKRRALAAECLERQVHKQCQLCGLGSGTGSSGAGSGGQGEGTGIVGEHATLA